MYNGCLLGRKNVLIEGLRKKLITGSKNNFKNLINS
jgi:hypothetical protein